VLLAEKKRALEDTGDGDGDAGSAPKRIKTDELVKAVFGGESGAEGGTGPAEVPDRREPAEILRDTCECMRRLADSLQPLIGN
jgi:hypothetical protein